MRGVLDDLAPPLGAVGPSLKGLNAGLSVVTGPPASAAADVAAAVSPFSSERVAGASGERGEQDQRCYRQTLAQHTLVQLLSSGAKAFSKSSSVPPTSLLPLMKKVGVCSTPKLWFARSRTATMSRISFSFLWQASKACARQPHLLGEPEQLRQELLAGLCCRPLLLLGEQCRDERHGALAAGAPRGHEGVCRSLVQGELAEHQPHLAGIDVLLLEGRQHVVVEVGARPAGQVGIFDDRHGRIGVADRELRQWPGLHELGWA